MFDQKRIEKNLESLEVYKERMTKLLPKTLQEYEKLDFDKKYAVERVVQLVSDTEMEIAVLLYRKAEPKPAGDVETMLGSLKDLLGEKIIKGMKEMRKLRNSLVHAYADSGYDKEVFEITKKTEAIEDFIEEVRKSLK